MILLITFELIWGILRNFTKLKLSIVMKQAWFSKLKLPLPPELILQHQLYHWKIIRTCWKRLLYVLHLNVSWKLWNNFLTNTNFYHHYSLVTSCIQSNSLADQQCSIAIHMESQVEYHTYPAFLVECMLDTTTVAGSSRCATLLSTMLSGWSATLNSSTIVSKVLKKRAT